MKPGAVSQADRRRQLGVAVLGIGAFTVGTSELVVVGILEHIARDIGVAVNTAGLSSPRTRAGSPSAVRS
ncbi:MAG TPA: hypothetical protein VEX15_08790 [Nocardioidaceae bacterium]|nr:hypothetical protein [Nocardioidaceae bacterium]